MGQFRFRVTPGLLEASELWREGYLCGIEGIPWETRMQCDGAILTARRASEESGRLVLPAVLDSRGPLTLSTCSLRPGPEPYWLASELARGSGSRVRSQLDLWQRSGLSLSEAFDTHLAAGTARLLDAVTLESDADRAAASLGAIERFEAAGDLLVDAYADQAMAYRRQHERQLGTLLGAALVPPGVAGTASEPAYREAFNSVAIRLSWAEVESDAARLEFQPFDDLFRWATQSGLRVIAGPLIDFQNRLLPDWIYLYEDDFDGLLRAVERYVDQTVRRYQGQVSLWHCAAGLNSPGPLALDESQRVHLAAVILQTARQADGQTPIVVSVDQPWGDYLAHHDAGISPLHFADALARGSFGLSGIGIELRMHYRTAASLPRSVLEISQLIDRWSMLGMPLLVQLALPAAAGPDPMATRAVPVIPLEGGGQTTATAQAALASRITKTLLAKSGVHGILWEGWDDRLPHPLPHTGLIAPDGQARPLLAELTRLRRQYLF